LMLRATWNTPHPNAFMIYLLVIDTQLLMSTLQAAYRRLQADQVS